jgi:hypothetical protein
MIDKVQELLFRAYFFMNSYRRLLTAYRNNTPSDAVTKNQYINLPLTNLVVLNANLYFFEAVSCLASLLRDIQPDPTKNEISFHGLADKLSGAAKEAFQTKLRNVFAEYKNSHIKDIRDKFVDHKDPKLSGDPSAAFINFRAEEVVDSCFQLIDKLKQIYREFFPEELSNDYFSDYYSDGIGEFVQILNERLCK